MVPKSRSQFKTLINHGGKNIFLCISYSGMLLYLTLNNIISILLHFSFQKYSQEIITFALLYNFEKQRTTCDRIDDTSLIPEDVA